MVGLYAGLYFVVAVVDCWLYNLAKIGNDYCLNVDIAVKPTRSSGDSLDEDLSI